MDYEYDKIDHLVDYMFGMNFTSLQIAAALTSLGLYGNDVDTRLEESRRRNVNRGTVKIRR